MQALKHDGSVSDFDDEHAPEHFAHGAGGGRGGGAQTRTGAQPGEVHRPARIQQRCRHERALRGRPGRRRGPAGHPDCEPGGARDRRGRARGPARGLQDGALHAWLASAPEEKFEVVLRELSAQAASQTRTYRARLKPATPRPLPLGATAMLVAERELAGPPLATIPAAAITQSQGQPALWTARRVGIEPMGTVELSPVAVHGYRNGEVLVSGLPARNARRYGRSAEDGARIARCAARRQRTTTYLTRVTP